MKMYKKLCSGAVAILLICASMPGLAETTWVDVRSLAEHKIDHIKGDTRVSNSEIVEAINKLAIEKDADIRLYCRSGKRAGVAMQRLLAAGYTNVTNVGGIEQARLIRGLLDEGD